MWLLSFLVQLLVLVRCLDLQLRDTAEKLFVVRLHFHKHFNNPPSLTSLKDLS